MDPRSVLDRNRGRRDTRKDNGTSLKGPGYSVSGLKFTVETTHWDRPMSGRDSEGKGCPYYLYTGWNTRPHYPFTELFVYSTDVGGFQGRTGESGIEEGKESESPDIVGKGAGTNESPLVTHPTKVVHLSLGDSPREGSVKA